MTERIKKTSKYFNITHVLTIFSGAIVLGGFILYLIYFYINFLRDNLGFGEDALSLAVDTGWLYGFIFPLFTILSIIFTITLQIILLSKTEQISRKKLIFPVIVANLSAIVFIFIMIFIQDAIFQLIHSFLAFFGTPG
ncbi:hypothetical protein HYX06_01345 [Candidatus Woesearchaeota archaeon]|nr:hypothetical protein [Candidatus Woesearchaeota archaeon]